MSTKVRRGDPPLFTLSWILITTLPLIHIYILVSNKSIYDILLQIWMILSLQCITSLILSTQYSCGGLFFLPSKYRKVNKQMVHFLHEEYGLKERLNSQVPNWIWCGNLLTDLCAIYDESTNLKLSQENKMVLKKLESMEGVYVKTWSYLVHCYHLTWFKYLVDKGNRWICRNPLESHPLQFEI